MNNIITLDQVRSVAPAAFSPIAAPELSDSYSHVTTANVLEALQQDGWQITKAEQSRSRIPGSENFGRHAIKLIHPELPAHREGTPQLHIGNSASGTSALRLLGGFLRQACLNQNYAGVKVVGGVFYHRGASLEDRVVAGARDLRRNFDKVIGAFDLWSKIELSYEQQANFFQRAVPLRWQSREVAGFSGTPGPRRHEDIGNSLFLTYNRTQEALIRGGFSARFTDRDEAGVVVSSGWKTVRKITGITANERINLGLWDLATEFAANR